MNVVISFIACSVSGLIFFLQSEHHHAIKGIKAGFNFILLVVCSPLAQLNNKRQNFIILRSIEREFCALQQLCVKLDKLLHYDLFICKCPFWRHPS